MWFQRCTNKAGFPSLYCPCGFRGAQTKRVFLLFIARVVSEVHQQSGFSFSLLPVWFQRCTNKAGFPSLYCPCGFRGAQTKRVFLLFIARVVSEVHKQSRFSFSLLPAWFQRCTNKAGFPSLYCPRGFRGAQSGVSFSLLPAWFQRCTYKAGFPSLVSFFLSNKNCMRREGLLVCSLTSQQQASVSHGRICSDNFTCCQTEIEAADPTFYLTQSQYTDTGPTSPSADPITPGAWHRSHWNANF